MPPLDKNLNNQGAVALDLTADSSGVAKDTVPSNHKRADYISWDDYFMGVAFLSSMRSKDPSTQVGACIVNEENKIVGIGKRLIALCCLTFGLRLA